MKLVCGSAQNSQGFLKDSKLEEIQLSEVEYQKYHFCTSDDLMKVSVLELQMPTLKCLTMFSVRMMGCKTLCTEREPSGSGLSDYIQSKTSHALVTA